MASYSDGAMMSQQSPSHGLSVMSQYPPPPDSTSPNNAPFPPQMYPNTDPALQPAPPLPPAPVPHQTPNASRSQGQTDGNETREYRNRLRKACDSCSIRKVKCNEEQPCKACKALEIPCTFERPSKRRGPPNRHADAIKRQRLAATAGETGLEPFSQPSSPTHAAQALASFAQQQVLSAEAIASWPVIQLLIDDYFLFIHPLIPVPHEPSFRQALDSRQDVSNPMFLALLASMIGCLVASFPRRARLHLRNHRGENVFPSSMSLVQRCHKVAIESQGPATFNRPCSVDDAILSYLQGLTSGYVFHRDSCLLYFRQGLAICTTLGLHKASFLRVNDTPVPRMTPNGQGLEGPHVRGGDLIAQELGKRTFWLLFTAIETIHQQGVSPFELSMPPPTKADPYPPLPLEVDDAFLTSTDILPQPEGYIPEMVGFNINTRIFASYKQISTNELIYGVDEVFDWDRQKKQIEQSLAEVKLIIESLPPALRISADSSTLKSSVPNYPSPGHELSPHHLQSNGGHFAFPNPERLSLQHGIQKANIYASQLGTRSYLVEKYFNLKSRKEMGDILDNAPPAPPQPTTNAIPSSSAPSTFTDSKPLSEEDMKQERHKIIKDFLNVLASVPQLSMEPNGASFVAKARAIGTTQLDMIQQEQGKQQQSPQNATMTSQVDKKPPGGVSVTPTPAIDLARAEEDLRAFVTVLEQLEHAVPANEKPAMEDEEWQLKKWADLKGEQERFTRAGGFMSL